MAYICYGLLGWAESRLGDYTAARAHLSQSKAIGQTIGGQLVFADWFSVARAELALLSGEVDAALAQAAEAAAAAKASGSMFVEALAERVWAQSLAGGATPRWDEALLHVAACVSTLEQSGSFVEAARSRVAWGVICQARGDAAPARQQFTTAAALFQAAGMNADWERTQQLVESAR